MARHIKNGTLVWVPRDHGWMSAGHVRERSETDKGIYYYIEFIPSYIESGWFLDDPNQILVVEEE